MTPKELRLAKLDQQVQGERCPRCQRPLQGRTRCQRPDGEGCRLTELEILRARLVKLLSDPVIAARARIVEAKTGTERVRRSLERLAPRIQQGGGT